MGGSMRKALSENLTALQAAGVNGLDKQEKIIARIKLLGLKLAQASVSRAMTNAVAVDLDTLEALSRAFEVDPLVLLTPGYAASILDAHPGSHERLRAILERRKAAERRRQLKDEEAGASDAVKVKRRAA